jgi:uncharacterized membrane protein YhhN
MLFDRWIARFRIKSNIGFLMYLSDSFGYMGSVVVLFAKNFFHPDLNWLSFIVNLAYVTGFLIIVLSIISTIYFRRKLKLFNIKQPITLSMAPLATV